MIPEYYRDSLKLETAFLLRNIKPLVFKDGQTPKVPGQASTRYCTLKGAAVPKNLYWYSNPTEPIAVSGVNIGLGFHEQSNIEKNSDDTSLKDQLLDAKTEIISLQSEIINLKEYKEMYKKILDTDYLFSSEKFLENWLHDNIHRVMPELEIIDRQPVASWPDGEFGRMDLFAKDKETNDIVVIEVKTRKRNIKSSYDQFLRYTSWVKKFKKVLETKYSKHSIKISNNPKFIIITDYTTDEMEAICKDHEITLIKVFGGLGFEKVS